MRTQSEWGELFKAAIDTEASYRLARSMEVPRTNPVLGYRTAGSRAEWETGELLRREMEAIGLKDVRKDAVKVDSWDFHHAVLRCRDKEGRQREFQLGAYQTDFCTEGFQDFSVVYLGRGTAASYRRRDVRGKLVLIDINQREEWWINFPVYQAHLKGAAALIAVQDQGYGEIHDTALNAQDIAGPAEAAAFSISRADAAILKEAMSRPEGDWSELQVQFDACSRVRRDATTYNIVGTIPGAEPEAMILLSAHYDSYFSGFQDDNAAVAMLLGIAKALLAIGYKPRKTLVFCAMAAEEWGVANSKYDWSTGAYEQVFTARPQWQGKVIANLNFELPAHAHGRKAAVRCTYEYAGFMEHFMEQLAVDREAYPDGAQVLYPIETWSDDFSMAIAGIPSMVNEFSGGEFMATHYHSQYDNENFYQEAVYRFNHQLYGRLVLALDRTAVVPMDFGRLFKAAGESIDRELCGRTGADLSRLQTLLEGAESLGKRIYGRIRQVNRLYEALLDEENEEQAFALAERFRGINRQLLSIFRKEQDYFVRLNWHDEVLFPQEAVQNNLKAFYKALRCLERREVLGALEAIYEIDNNRYAFLFDEEVFRYFTEYVLEQPADRLKWGTGRIVHHENLFRLVQRLRVKLKERQPDVRAEYRTLLEAAENQEASYRDDIRYMCISVEKLSAALSQCSQGLERLMEKEVR